LDLYININSSNPELDKYLADKSFNNWAIITAHNPQSKILLEKENQERNKSLFEEIKNYSYLKTESSSKDTKDDWPIEVGYIIFNIDQESACNIGEDFNQRAIVIGEKDKEAKIIDLASF
jgi:hypothetical protein